MKLVSSIVWLAVMALVCLTGCVSPAPKDLATADCGPCPKTPVPAIHGWMERNLLDPYTAVIVEHTEPKRGALQRGLIYGGGYIYGWKTFVTLNSKNIYGAYTGASMYYMLIRDDVVVHAEKTEDYVLPFLCH